MVYTIECMEGYFSIELEPEWIAPDRRIALLTVFAKTRPRERSEVGRAQQAQIECESWHDHATAVHDREREQQ